jgi:hypothetical protein
MIEKVEGLVSVKADAFWRASEKAFSSKEGI